MKGALEILALVIQALPAIGKFIVQVGRKERKKKREKKQNSETTKNAA